MKCPKCGAEIKPEDQFCGGCGAILSGTTPIPEMGGRSTTKTSSGLSENTKGMLCYLFGWLGGIVFLLIEKENKFVRFHAIQSVITFLILMILSIAVQPTSYYDQFSGTYRYSDATLSYFVSLLTLILWVVLMYKAYQGEKFKLPIIGDFAEKRVMS